MAESFVITRKTNPSRVSVDANIETRFMMAELIRALRELEFALPYGEAPVTSSDRDWVTMPLCSERTTVTEKIGDIENTTSTERYSNAMNFSGAAEMKPGDKGQPERCHNYWSSLSKRCIRGEGHPGSCLYEGECGKLTIVKLVNGVAAFSCRRLPGHDGACYG